MYTHVITLCLVDWHLPPSSLPTSLQAKLAFERLDIEKAYHPFIMGPNNTVLKSISEATGARINMPPISLMKDELTVAGDKDAVAKAVTQIKKIYEDMVS